MSHTSIKACTFLSLLAGAFMGLGIFPLMQMFPPLDPAMTAAEVASFYRGNATGVISGGILVMLSSPMIMPFLGAIAVFIKKIEGEHAPLTWTFVGLSGFAFTPFFISGLGFTLAAYRPEAPDDIIRLFSDFSILMLVVPALVFIGCSATLGAAILTDRRAKPVFARWVGYFQVFISLLSLPAGVVPLFKVGPFAWHGELGFWLPVIMFGIWWGITIWAILDSLKRGALEAA